MASINIHRDSFNAGELAPTLAARYAVEKVGSGCRTMRNMYPHAHGPALRRPGTKYMGDAVGSGSSLRTFTFSASTTALLEFSPWGLGVWQDGERVPINPVDLPYDDEDCQELQIVQVNDVCYIAHKNHPPAKLVRWSDTDWRYSVLEFDWPPLGDENFRSDEIGTPTVTTVLTEVCPATTGNGATYVLAANTDWRAEFAAGVGMTGQVIVQRLSGASWVTEMEMDVVASTTTTRRGRKFTGSRSLRFRFVGSGMSGTGYIKTLAFPTSTAITLACSATSGTGLTLTASEAVFISDHIGSVWQITHARTDAHTTIVSAVPTVSAANSTAIKVVGSWSVNTYGSWDATLYVEKYIGGAWETVRSYSAVKDRNIIDSGNEDTPVMMRLRVSAGTSVAVTSGAGVTGAATPRFVLENREARISGLVKITARGALNPEGKATTATVDVISELHSTTATSLWTPAAFHEDNYPRAVALHGGRLWFGGTDKEPQRVWGSVVNDFENFRRSTYDDAGLSFTPASQKSNAIQWLASYMEYLVIGTTMDEWTATGESGFITPLNLSVRRRSGYGSAYQQAQFIGESLVFVARDRRHFRQIIPRTASDSEEWSAANLNTLADHLIDPEEEIIQFAVQNSPISALWAVISDGTLIGLTFERDQNIFAWHRHDFGEGHIFTSVAVVPDADKDFVYFNKWATLDPASGPDIQSYQILRFHNEVLDRNWSDAAYVDSYVNQVLTLVTNTAEVITGLTHLIGLSPVVYNKDNKYQVTHTAIVSDAGELTIPYAAIAGGGSGNYRIGLPFTSQLQMMRFDVPLRDGTSQGRKWKTNRVRVKLIASRGGTISDGPMTSPDTERKHDIETPTASLQPVDFEFETAVRSITRDGCDVTLETTDPWGMNVQSITWKGEISGE